MTTASSECILTLSVCDAFLRVRRWIGGGQTSLDGKMPGVNTCEIYVNVMSFDQKPSTLFFN